MRRVVHILLACTLVGVILLTTPGPAMGVGVGPDQLAYCRALAYSTEEDFVTFGPEPPDGNPIISDGDLLGPDGVVCARNYDLTHDFDTQPYHDLGLDAVDVREVVLPAASSILVVFSTELDSPNTGQFTAGDLLITNGAIVRNTALTELFGVRYDIGLDAVQLVGSSSDIDGFLEALAGKTTTSLTTLWPDFPTVDIWFSTEGTFRDANDKIVFLDGDLLSARHGTVLVHNKDLLPAGVPSGIPDLGVDFGLDAVTSNRTDADTGIYYSTELLFDGDPAFTDGDVLVTGDGVAATNWQLIAPFKPAAKMLGLDALSMNRPEQPPCVSRITKIGGVDTADIDPVAGTVNPLVFGPSLNAPAPFGGNITLEGAICDNVERFRVLYRLSGTTSWTDLDVPPAAGWNVKADAFFPPGPDCLGTQTWSSASGGWFDGTAYRHLSEAALGGCNPGLALTVWETGSAIPDPDSLYEVMLVTETAAETISDTVRMVQLDNTAPEVVLEKQAGTCSAYSSDNMPLMVTGHISDTFFYRYRLMITGNSYSPHYYPLINYWDDLTDNVIATGTMFYPTDVDLHEVSVFDLAASPVECGYTVGITAWDRTVVGSFTYPSNVATRCVGCRHNGDFWTFNFTP